MRGLLALLPLLLLAGCGGPPVGDAPEARDARPASGLPPNDARRTLAAIRPHGGGKGR